MQEAAKKLFVEHLRKTRIPAVVETKAHITSSVGGDQRTVSVSRIEISDEPLPIIRAQLLSRDAGNADSRFLLDQTIDLGTNDPSETRMSFWVWDPVNNRARLIPVDPFMSFPGTSVRLVDHLLPVPELVESWAIVAGEAGRDVLELGIHDPLPAVFSPQWRKIRIHVGSADRRLHRTEVIFGDDRRHVAEVLEWATIGDIHGLAKVKITDGTQWTQLELSHSVRDGWGAEKFTRHRLETGAGF